MRVVLKVTVTALIGLSFLSSNLYADGMKGLKIYQQKLQKECGPSNTFAGSHTQEEWKKAKENGKLTQMMLEQCPEGADFFESDRYKDNYIHDLYDFVYQFASDSIKIPACS